MTGKQDVYAAAVTLLCLLGNGQLPACLTMAWHEAQGCGFNAAITEVLLAKQQLSADFMAGSSSEPQIMQMIDHLGSSDAQLLDLLRAMLVADPADTQSAEQLARHPCVSCHGSSDCAGCPSQRNTANIQPHQSHTP
jgi:hypothetical protein